MSIFTHETSRGPKNIGDSNYHNAYMKLYSSVTRDELGVDKCTFWEGMGGRSFERRRWEWEIGEQGKNKADTKVASGNTRDSSTSRWGTALEAEAGARNQD